MSCGAKSQRLPEFHFTLAQCACEDFVLRDVDPGSDEPLGHSAVFAGVPTPPDMTNRSVRLTIRFVKSIGCSEHVGMLRTKSRSSRMHERHVFLDGGCLLRRSGVDRETTPETSAQSPQG